MRLIELLERPDYFGPSPAHLTEPPDPDMLAALEQSFKPARAGLNMPS